VCFIWQDSYAKLEFAMTEMECGSITLKEKLAESEKSIKDAENLTKELSLKNDTLIKVDTNK
jgi:hypothetical protein